MLVAAVARYVHVHVDVTDLVFDLFGGLLGLVGDRPADVLRGLADVLERVLRNGLVERERGRFVAGVAIDVAGASSRSGAAIKSLMAYLLFGA